MARSGPKPLDEKHHVLAMLRLGEFASLAEAAELAGVSPQRVGQWAEAERIDWRKRRAQRIRSLWLLHLRRARSPAKRLTKAERGAQTARLIAEFKAKKARSTIG